jgi:hypothetical protein
MADSDDRMDISTEKKEEEIDLTGDKGVLKLRLKEGDGWETPKDGDDVTVHYTGKLLDGTVFDSSVERGTPFSFKLGRHQVIKGWEEAVQSMKKGEKVCAFGCCHYQPLFVCFLSPFLESMKFVVTELELMRELGPLYDVTKVCLR